MYVSVLFHWDECLQCMRILTETYCMFFFFNGSTALIQKWVGTVIGPSEVAISQIISHYYPLVNLQKSY